MHSCLRIMLRFHIIPKMFQSFRCISFFLFFLFFFLLKRATQCSNFHHESTFPCLLLSQPEFNYSNSLPHYMPNHLNLCIKVYCQIVIYHVQQFLKIVDLKMSIKWLCNGYTFSYLIMQGVDTRIISGRTHCQYVIDYVGCQLPKVLLRMQWPQLYEICVHVYVQYVNLEQHTSVMWLMVI